MIGNWPKLWEFSLIFTVPVAVFVSPILAFTGYGWNSLYFLIGIPSVVAAFCAWRE